MKKEISEEKIKKRTKIKKKEPLPVCIVEERFIPTYDHFISMSKNPFYFKGAEHDDLIKLAPLIRKYLLARLSERPYELGELTDLLYSDFPELSVAYGHILEQVGEGGEDFEECDEKLREISDGIEVRVFNGQNYLGLTKKLDSV